MFTTAPYLRVRRPSPTTAEFTVSTLPPLTTPLRLLLRALDLVRAALGLAVLLVLYSVWAGRTPSPTTTPASEASLSPSPPATTAAFSLSRPSSLEPLLRSLLSSTALGRLAAAPAAALPPWALVPLCLGALWLLGQRVRTEESLLVLRGLGVQTSSGAGAGVGAWAGVGVGAAGPTRFIPTGKIRDVLINEAFSGFGVRSYLVVVVDGEEDVVVVFPRLLPGARIVERVWRGVRECLYEEGGERKEGGGG